jgi:hypothetical protein
MNGNLYSILFIVSLVIFFAAGSFTAKLFHLESYIKESQKKSTLRRSQATGNSSSDSYRIPIS